MNIGDIIHFMTAGDLGEHDPNPSTWKKENRIKAGVFEYAFPDGHTGWAKYHYNCRNKNDVANLPTERGGIVEITASVSPRAYLEPDTCVYGTANVQYGVLLKDFAQVGGDALVKGGGKYITAENKDSLKHVVIIRGEGKVLCDTEIQHPLTALVADKNQREILEKIRKAERYLKSGIIIEGTLDGWSNIVGAEIEIGSQVTLIDCECFGRKIKLDGEKTIVEKKVVDNRPNVESFEPYSVRDAHPLVDFSSFEMPSILDGSSCASLMGDLVREATAPKAKRFIQRDRARRMARAGITGIYQNGRCFSVTPDKNASSLTTSSDSPTLPSHE